MTDRPFPTIAIVGVSGAFPGAPDVETLWRSQAEGQVLTRRLAPAELRAAGIAETEIADPNFVPVESMLDGYDLFDADFFNVSPRDAALMDPQHRLALEHAYAALENSGYAPRSLPFRTGLYLGIGLNHYLLHYVQYAATGHDGNGELAVMVGNEKSYAATRIAHRLNLRGPCMAVDTACSTSLVAVHQACAALLAYECDMALAGGVRVQLPAGRGYRYVEGGVYSRDGRCAPFDASASGTLQGSGVGMVVLRRLEDAVADGDCIRGVIRATAVNNDGNGKIDYAAPSVTGQADVIEAALALAEVDPAQIGYVETHGTGTALGDPIEFAALQRAFQRSKQPRRTRCYLGSAKANMGHLDVAAGVTGLIRAVGALERAEVPPMANFTSVNGKIDLERSPFAIPTRAEPFPTADEEVRYAAVSSFGIGGTNAHVILESAPAGETKRTSRRWHLLPLSARSADGLRDLARAMARRAGAGVDLDAMAYTLQCGREAHPWRGTLVVDSLQAVEQSWGDDTHTWLGNSTHVETSPPAVAFQFPGQGTLPAAAAAELYAEFALFRKHLDAALAIAPSGTRERLLSPAGATSSDDEIEQVALVIFEFSMAKTLEALGIAPAQVLGHSLGEYVAAAVAGVFDLRALITIVRARGRAMAAMPEGRMLSVAVDEDGARALLQRHPNLDLAAVNAASQCVLAGAPEAIAGLEADCTERGLLHRLLPTRRAFHSRHTDAVLETFANGFAGIELKPPTVGLVSNVFGAAADDSVCQPAYWLRHLREPVHYSRGVGRLCKQDGPILIEVGAGQVLSGLARAHGVPAHRTCSTVGAEVVGSARHFLRALGQLWQHGVRVDFRALYEGEQRRRVALPATPLARVRHWVDLVPEARGPGGWVESSAVADAELPVQPQLYSAVWQRTTLPMRSESPPLTTLLLVAPETPLAQSLETRLCQSGRRVQRVAFEESFDAVCRWKEDADQPEKASRVVLLLPAVKGRHDDSQLQQLKQVLAQLITVARDCESGASPVGLTVVTQGAQDVTGDGRVDPLHASMTATLRVLAQEHASLCLRVIDLPEHESLSSADVDQAVDVLLSEPLPFEVAVRYGRRWREAFEVLEAPMVEAPQLRAHGRYLVLGGLGGIGRAIALHLARRTPMHLVLVGRSVLPDESEWDALVSKTADDELTARIAFLRELRALGVTWETHGQMPETVEGWRNWLDSQTQFDGVVHAAGVSGVGLAKYKSAEQIDAVIDSKLVPLFAIARSRHFPKLDFLLLCSSLVGMIGGLGQADYAAANAGLDAFARALPHGPRVLSLAWDQWQQTGMSRRDYRAPRAWDRASAPPVWRAADRPAPRLFRVRAEQAWPLREHVLGGAPVLPGTAIIDILLQSAGCTSLHYLQWLHPGHADAAGGLDISVRAEERGNERFIEVCQRLDGSEVVLANAWLPRDDHASPSALTSNLAQILSRCIDCLADDADASMEVLPAAKSGVAAFGPRWHSINSIYRGEGELLAELALKPEFCQDLEYYEVHPALLDAATGLLAACLLEEGVGAALPVALDSLTVHGRMPATFFSWVRRAPEGAGHRFDIDLIKADGSVFLEVRGLELREPRSRVGRSASAASPEVPETGLTADQALAPLLGLLSLEGSRHVALSTHCIQRRRLHLRDAAALAPAQAEAGAVVVEGEDVSDLHWQIARLWANQLGVRQLHVDQDFFEVGGNSLSAMQVVAKLREQHGVQYDVRALYDYPTLRRFAEYVDVAKQSGAAPADADWTAPPELAEHPLSPAQKRLWFLAHSEDDGATYNIPVYSQLEGALNLPRLRAALLGVESRHEVLRLRWFRRADEMRQAPADIRAHLPVVDLAGLPVPTRNLESERLLGSDAREPFEWLERPLSRQFLIRLQVERHVLAWSLHHAIADHWSVGILMRDLFSLYAGRSLPAPGLRYVDYAWQQQRAQAESKRAEGLRFWRSTLADAPEVLALPLDRERPPVQSNRGARAEMQLPASLCARLERLALEHGASLYMVLLAAFKGMLSGLTGQTHMVIGTPVANRPEPFTDCVGFFANTIAICTRFGASDRFTDLLSAVRRSALDAYAHQDVPFDEVVAAVARRRNLSITPVVQALVVLQNAPMPDDPDSGLTITQIDRDTGTAKFDLVLAMYQGIDGLRCHVEHRLDILGEESVRALLDKFGQVLERVARDPGCRLHLLANDSSSALDRAPSTKRTEEFVL